jgi:hypothetical protein
VGACIPAAAEPVEAAAAIESRRVVGFGYIRSDISRRAIGGYFMGEKSVGVRNVESIFSTNSPLASDAWASFFHSGSLWNSFSAAQPASRLCARR